MDKRGGIHGTRLADVNGKCSVATDFHPAGLREWLCSRPMRMVGYGEGRYPTALRCTAQLDSGGASRPRFEECVRVRRSRPRLTARARLSLGVYKYIYTTRPRYEEKAI